MMMMMMTRSRYWPAQPRVKGQSPTSCTSQTRLCLLSLSISDLTTPRQTREEHRRARSTSSRNASRSRPCQRASNVVRGRSRNCPRIHTHTLHDMLSHSIADHHLNPKHTHSVFRYATNPFFYSEHRQYLRDPPWPCRFFCSPVPSTPNP